MTEENKKVITQTNMNQAITGCGDCICPKCGKKEKHKLGVPCRSMKCKDCDNQLERDINIG